MAGKDKEKVIRREDILGLIQLVIIFTVRADA